MEPDFAGPLDLSLPPKPQDGRPKKRRRRRSRRNANAQSPSVTTATKRDYAHLPVTELKALCRTHGLSSGGGKAVLMARLEEFDRGEHAPGPLNTTTDQVGISGPSRRSEAEKKINKQSQCQVIPINVLFNDVLLLIFEFYMDEDEDEDPDIYLFRSKKQEIEVWQTLVHVCRRWRSIIFGSPRSLNLRLVCTDKTLVEKINVWPPLRVMVYGSRFSPSRLDNIIAALEHNDRISDLMVDHYSIPVLEKILAVMRQPFPALTTLKLELSSEASEEAPLAIPDSFLGGSAPGLQEFVLQGILYPALQNLLLSATNLSTLFLMDAPRSGTGYISPEEMVHCLSVLTSLKDLSLEFPTPLSRPSQTSQYSHSPTRVVLPTLTRLSIVGFSECLEDLVARIDTPLLNYFILSFPNQPAFDTPQVIQFISRAPELKTLDEVQVIIDSSGFELRLPLPTSTRFDDTELELGASYNMSYNQLSSMAQTHSSSPFPVSTVKNLYIRESDDPSTGWDGNVEEARWLLHPFTSVTNLYVSEELWEFFECALEDDEGERATEVLPALQEIEHYWR